MAKQALTIIKETLLSLFPKYKPTLPEHINPARFQRAVMTAIQNTPYLADASKASIYKAVQQAAQDGLLLDGREAALVIFRGKAGTTASYIPMIAGILKKVRQSGQLSMIAAHVVYEEDDFIYQLGDDEKVFHKPKLGDRGKAVAVYAIARLKDGSIQREVMGFDEVERIRQTSRAANNGPWVTHWGEMARKTVLKRLAKYLPQSTDLEILYEDDPMYGIEKVAKAKPRAKPKPKPDEVPADDPDDATDDATDDRQPTVLDKIEEDDEADGPVIEGEVVEDENPAPDPEDDEEEDDDGDPF